MSDTRNSNICWTNLFFDNIFCITHIYSLLSELKNPRHLTIIFGRHWIETIGDQVISHGLMIRLYRLGVSLVMRSRCCLARLKP
jgi:hypothetical protein